jgi:hypothetical protein
VQPRRAPTQLVVGESKDEEAAALEVLAEWGEDIEAFVLEDDAYADKNQENSL